MNEKLKVMIAHLKEQLPDAKESWISSKGSSVTLGWIHAADPLAVELLIAALEQLQQQNAQLSHYLHCAHGFIEHTEAFGHECFKRDSVLW